MARQRQTQAERLVGWAKRHPGEFTWRQGVRALGMADLAQPKMSFGRAVRLANKQLRPEGLAIQCGQRNRYKLCDNAEDEHALHAQRRAALAASTRLTNARLNLAALEPETAEVIRFDARQLVEAIQFRTGLAPEEVERNLAALVEVAINGH